MTKAREVIAKRLLSFQVDRDNHEEAASDILKLLDSAGYAIVPKEPLVELYKLLPPEFVIIDGKRLEYHDPEASETLLKAAGLVAMLLTAQKEG